MNILSIGQNISYTSLQITSITESQLSTQDTIQAYDYIIIHGGDGTIRRVLKALQGSAIKARFILNPTGSFNVIAKLHKVPSLQSILDKISKNTPLIDEKHQYFSLNQEVFLFSAGNMGDLQHIFLAETLRFGILKKGITKYLLAVLFLLPLHLIMTPFMLLSPRRFFIFTPARFIPKIGSFRGEVVPMNIHLENNYNLIELDGDIVTIAESTLKIQAAGFIRVVVA